MTNVVCVCAYTMEWVRLDALINFQPTDDLCRILVNAINLLWVEAKKCQKEKKNKFRKFDFPSENTREDPLEKWKNFANIINAPKTYCSNTPFYQNVRDANEIRA